MAKKKDVKSIFGNKKLQKIQNESDPPPDKRDYLEDFFEHEHSTVDRKESSADPIEPPVAPQSEEEDNKVYKSYYAYKSSHSTFRDIVHTLRHKVDPDLNNGEVFELMLQHYREHIEQTHGELMKAKPPKKGRR